jgi:uncharacterized membrane protein
MSTRIFLLNLFACLWCSFVLNLRFHLAGHHYYAFMLWNLFLAAIPLGLSLGLRRINSLALALPVLAVWLLFFPNAPYVLTDLLHLNETHSPVPKWLDLLMLLSFALVSLWFGFQSMHIVQHWFARKFSHATAWCVTVGTLGLSGFGVYLGRFDRWNSWDLVHRPFALLAASLLTFSTRSPTPAPGGSRSALASCSSSPTSSGFQRRTISASRTERAISRTDSTRRSPQDPLPLVLC